MIAGSYRFWISDSGLCGLFSGRLPVHYFVSTPNFADLDMAIDLTLPQNKDTADSNRGWPEIGQCNIPSWRTIFDVIIIEGNKTAKGWTSMFVWNCSGTAGRTRGTYFRPGSEIKPFNVVTWSSYKWYIMIQFHVTVKCISLDQFDVSPSFVSRAKIPVFWKWPPTFFDSKICSMRILQYQNLS